jgi:hypothetical protein
MDALRREPANEPEPVTMDLGLDPLQTEHLWLMSVLNMITFRRNLALIKPIIEPSRHQGTLSLQVTLHLPERIEGERSGRDDDVQIYREPVPLNVLQERNAEAVWEQARALLGLALLHERDEAMMVDGEHRWDPHNLMSGTWRPDHDEEAK